MSKVITPTVGRKVWYRPSAWDCTGPGAMQTAGDPIHATGKQPLDATIIAVWSDRMVNVLVTDIMGKQFPVLSCQLLQPGENHAVDGDGNPIGRYCEWMPYQVGQAEKVAAAAEIVEAGSAVGA